MWLSTPTLPGPHSEALAQALQDQGHTYSPWFKSTLLLFLRLLLSTKKRWPAKPFFFFFFQEKQATENGILQIYKHGENGQNALRMAWLCEDPHRAAPAAGECVPSQGNVWFPASPSAEAPPVPPIPDRPVPGDPAATTVPPGRTAVRGAVFTEPAGSGPFPVAMLSSL